MAAGPASTITAGSAPRSRGDAREPPESTAGADTRARSSRPLPLPDQILEALVVVRQGDPDPGEPRRPELGEHARPTLLLAAEGGLLPHLSGAGG